MRLFNNARYLEFQVVVDDASDTMALYGSRFSVQLIHQRIIKEGHVLAAPPDVWKRLENATVNVAKEIGYIGTVIVKILYKGDPFWWRILLCRTELSLVQSWR